MRSSTLVILAGVALATAAIYYLTRAPDGGSPRSSASAAVRSAAPTPTVERVPAKQHEGLSMFVKVKACEATTCDEVACEKFSDGQSTDGPAHLARCRWLDRSRTDAPHRCAYAHYVEQPGKQGLGALFLSTPNAGECAPDQAFNDLLKNDVGYTGQLP